MIALDTNILIYAHRRQSPFHSEAKTAIEEAANSKGGCGTPITCLIEFFSIVTHPSSEGGPSSSEQAFKFINALKESAGLSIWYPRDGYENNLFQLAQDLSISGVRIFDLQIALMAWENGATEIWTNDKNFGKIPGLRIHHPFG